MPARDPIRQSEIHRRWYTKGASEDERQIYALLDPVDRKPRYVGMTVNAEKRVRLHWKQRDRRMTPIALWLRTLEVPPEIWLIQTVPVDQGVEAELYWINLLAGIDTLDLLNVVRGHRKPTAGTGPLRGEQNKSAKLTEDDVRAIRASPEKQQALADRYGITQAAVSHIRSRKTWTHVT